MVQIIPAAHKKKETDWAQLLMGAGQIAQGAYDKYKDKQAQKETRDWYKSTTGKDMPKTNDPKLQQAFIADALKGKSRDERFKKLSASLGMDQENDVMPDDQDQNFTQSNQTREDQDYSPTTIYSEDEENLGNTQPKPNKTKQKKFNPSDLSEEQVTKLGIEEPALARVVQHQRDVDLREESGRKKAQRDAFESDRDFHTKRSAPLIDAAQKVMEQAPINKGLSQQSRRAVESGNVSGIVPFLTAKYGYNPAINPDLATFMAAQKHKFLGDLQANATGVRANQFLERLMTQAQAKAGSSEEANLDVIDGDDFIEDLKVKRAETILKLADQDYKKYGYERSDIGRRANDIMTDYAEKAQNKLAYTIRNRHVSALSDQELAQEMASKQKADTDQPLTPREAQFIYLKHGGNMKAANKEIQDRGYKILGKGEYESF